MKRYKVGWTFNLANLNPPDNEIIWHIVPAHNEKEACARLAKHVDNHMARITCKGEIK